MTIILGVDPSLTQTGWGVISFERSLKFIAAGSIKTSASDNIASRLCSIHEALSSVIKQYSPCESAIEETFVNKNPSTSLKLGQARGAIMLTLSLANMEIHEYAPTLVKKTVVGVGRADKTQIGRMVKCLLPTAHFEDNDASDALAVAICHSMHRTKLKIY